MTYRDELEAMRARLAELEAELASAKALQRPAASSTSLRISVERSVEGEMPESARAEIGHVVSRVLGVSGTSTSEGRSWVWRHAGWGNERRNLSVVVAARNGRTTIRIAEDLSPAVAGTVAAGAVTLALSLGAAVVAGALSRSMFVLAALPLGILGLGRLLWNAYRSLWVARRDGAESLATEIAEIATDAIARGGAPSVRVAEEHADEAEVARARRATRAS